MRNRPRIRYRRRCLSHVLLAVLAVFVASIPVWSQGGDGDVVKNISGIVRDLRGEPVTGARVFIRNLDTNVVRTHTTGSDGVYAVNGLRPDADYEVHAEFRGATTEARLVSQFLVRRDNVLNFDLPIAVIPEGVGGDGDGGIPLETFDRVVLRATFQLPEGLSGPFPVALLLHGFGEDRSVWFDLEARLLEEGWAVMALDLRGHGGSTTRNAERIEPQEGWRTDPQQFPLDLVPAINWLQTQERVSSGRMAVIGFDVGANLALIASGRYREVATAVAINANVAEAEAMAGAGQEFVPSTVQIIASSAAAAETVRQHVQGASRVTIVPGAGGTIGWVATGNALDEIIRWLRDTY